MPPSSKKIKSNHSSLLDKLAVVYIWILSKTANAVAGRQRAAVWIYRGFKCRFIGLRRCRGRWEEERLRVGGVNSMEKYTHIHTARDMQTAQPFLVSGWTLTENMQHIESRSSKSKTRCLFHPYANPSFGLTHAVSQTCAHTHTEVAANIPVWGGDKWGRKIGGEAASRPPFDSNTRQVVHSDPRRRRRRGGRARGWRHKECH